ncbi:winged helix-turn-helix transcriptional regulator [Rubrivirga sp.]|uniref:winged helix-turn-helix transcriptional regulator n=1 Tax=Rubrivirga sp. TaxID=1885344 RepID=UPI003C76F8C0
MGAPLLPVKNARDGEGLTNRLEMATFTLGDRSFSCPVELSLSTVGSKWAALVVWHLRTDTLRYSELRRRLTGVSHKMLSQRLRDLEADGLISRTVYPVVPPKTEYALTDEGRRLVPALEAMQRWGMAYKDVA